MPENMLPRLRALGHDVLGVVSAPNKRRPELLEELQKLRGVEVRVAERAGDVAALVRPFGAELAICSGFPWRLPAEALEATRLGILNGHPSLLPRWRGPNPFGWTFRAGDEVLGFTWHLMDAALDTGPIVLQGSSPIGDEDGTHSLWELLPPLAGATLAQALEHLEAGGRGRPQSDEGATWAPRFEDDYAEIDWRRTAREVHNQIRSWFLPTPGGLFGAHTTLNGERVRIIRSELVDHDADGAPGTELDDGLVRCGDRPLRIVAFEPA